jgi:hypothetical protein
LVKTLEGKKDPVPNILILLISPLHSTAIEIPRSMGPAPGTAIVPKMNENRQENYRTKRSPFPFSVQAFGRPACGI